MQYLASHMRGILARQKQHAGRDFVRLTGYSKGDGISETRNLVRGKEAGIKGVHMGPGATPFTRIPSAASALYGARTKDTIAPLVEA